MATYTPLQLIPVTSLTSTTAAGAKYSSPASTSGIIRTINVQAQAAATFSVSLGAAAPATYIFSGQALTASVASIYNGWWVTAAGSADAINMHSNVTSASSVTGTVGGYTYA